MCPALSPAEIGRAIRSSLPIAFRTVTATEDFFADLRRVLDLCLEELGQEQMREGLFFCLQELVSNARKANDKRVYFRERDLDIEDPLQYEEGIREFRSGAVARSSGRLELLEALGYHIDVEIRRRGDSVELAVTNNVEMVPRERARAYNRIAKSRAYAVVEEAYASILDDTEGGGLGLTIVLLYLRKLGLPEESFEIDSRNGATTARVTVPFSKMRLEGLAAVSGLVVKHVEDLPTFPERVRELDRLLSEPDASLPDIAKLVSRDPAFTTDLLRYANSASLAQRRRVESVVDAVRLAGFGFLRSMLYSYATRTILADRYPEMRELWVHSDRVALYAYHLARSILRDRRCAEDAYVGGMLHDMGTIVVNYLFPRLQPSVEDFARSRGFPQNLVEAVCIGVSHAEIGAMVAAKWSFPPVLVSAIRYHHEPMEAPEGHRAVVASIYLANLLAIYGEAIGLAQIDPGIRARFGLGSKEKLDKVRLRLAEAYREAADPVPAREPR